MSVPVSTPSPIEITKDMSTRLNVAARCFCMAPRLNSRMMNSKVATGPGMVRLPMTSVRTSQPITRVARPTSRKTGLASLPKTFFLLRVVLGGVGIGIELLHAHHIGTSHFHELVHELHELVDHLLVPLLRNAGFPAVPHRREQAGVRQAVKLVVEDALPDAVVAVFLHQLDGFLRCSEEPGERLGIRALTSHDHQDGQVIPEAHLGKQARDELNVTVLSGPDHAGY